MRFFHSIICVMTCIFLLMPLMTSCRKITDSRYIETDITPKTDEQILAVFQEKDTFIVYTKGLRSIYTSTNYGESWTKEAGPGVKFPELSETSLMARGEDGTIVLCPSGDYNTKLEKITPDGKLIDQPVRDYDAAIDSAEKEKQNIRLSDLQMLPNGRIMAGYIINNATYAELYPDIEKNQFSNDSPETTWNNAYYNIKNGELMHQFGEYDLSMPVTRDDRFIYTITGINKLYLYDINSGERTYEFPMGYDDRDDFVTNRGIAVSKDGNTLYAVDAEKMWKVDIQNFSTETLFNSSHYAFGDTDENIEQLFCADEHNFIVQMTQNGETKLFRYTYHDEVDIDPQKHLKIWTLQENTVLRAAIREYMSENPDAAVELEVALDENSVMTKGDALRDLNTRLLAGDGPDVLLLDECPIENYVKSGLLMNLSGRLDFDGVLQPVRDAYDIKDHTYYFPIRFSMPLLVWNEETATRPDSYESFIKILENGKSMPYIQEKKSLLSLPPEKRATMCIDYDDYVTDLFWMAAQQNAIQENTLNRKKFASFLEDMKLVKAKYFSSKTLFGTNELHFLARQTNYAAFILRDLPTLTTLKSYQGSFASFPGLEEKNWIPSSFVSINSKSIVKDYAVEFVQFMLGDTVQSTQSGGISVTDSGAKMQLLGAGENADDFEMDELIAMMKSPLTIDTMVRDTVYDASEKIAYTKTDEVVKEVEEKLQTYFSEKA